MGLGDCRRPDQQRGAAGVMSGPPVAVRERESERRHTAPLGLHQLDQRARPSQSCGAGRHLPGARCIPRPRCAAHGDEDRDDEDGELQHRPHPVRRAQVEQCDGCGETAATGGVDKWQVALGVGKDQPRVQLLLRRLVVEVGPLPITNQGSADVGAGEVAAPDIERRHLCPHDRVCGDQGNGDGSDQACAAPCCHHIGKPIGASAREATRDGSVTLVARRLVEPGGAQTPTSCMPCKALSQLSYGPAAHGSRTACRQRPWGSRRADCNCKHTCRQLPHGNRLSHNVRYQSLSGRRRIAPCLLCRQTPGGCHARMGIGRIAKG